MGSPNIEPNARAMNKTTAREIVMEISQNNSQVALKALFMHYYGKLFCFVSGYVASREEAEEIASDVFVTVWKNRSDLHNVQNITSWLYTIARNMAVSHTRKQASIRHGAGIDTAEYLAGDMYDNPETKLIGAELLDKFDRVVETLPAKSREVFKLVRFHGLRYREAADVLGVTEKTIEAHMTSAVKKIRESIHVQKRKSLYEAGTKYRPYNKQGVV